MTEQRSTLHAVALRLRPGDDLIGAIEAWAAQNAIGAACVLTCVGSLTRARLRFANRDEWTERDGPFEIVALTGTISTRGSHYHIALSDGEGRTLGAHVAEGCVVYTTAELVLGELPDLRFDRVFDPASGYDELVVDRTPS
jgi:uncharacterized protein